MQLKGIQEEKSKEKFMNEYRFRGRILFDKI